METTWLDERFLKRLVATERGRAFLLSFMADAEESDEVGVFDALLSRVEDPALHRLVAKHKADEERHAAMLRARLATLAVPAPPVRPELRIISRIDRLLGGFGAAFVGGRTGIMEAYVLLQVIEERAVRQFPRIARALAQVDPAGADTVFAILRDEERHVRYARAISERYAPDATTLARTLARYRVLEQRAFDENGQAFLRHAVEGDLLSVGRGERMLWRGLVLLGTLPRRGVPHAHARAAA